MARDPELDRQERPQRPGARIALVVSSFHRELTGAMAESARRELVAGGLREDDLPVVWVPGAFELPLVARRLARDPRIDAVLCFGLVLKGETTHDLHVARGAVDGIQRAMLDTDKPVLLGVLTCETMQQARDRALPPERGGRHDKGREVARAALEVLAALDSVAETGAPARPVGFPHHVPPAPAERRERPPQP